MLYGQDVTVDEVKIFINRSERFDEHFFIARKIFDIRGSRGRQEFSFSKSGTGLSNEWVLYVLLLIQLCYWSEHKYVIIPHWRSKCEFFPSLLIPFLFRQKNSLQHVWNSKCRIIFVRLLLCTQWVPLILINDVFKEHFTGKEKREPTS